MALISGRSQAERIYTPLFLDKTGDIRPSVEREFVSISNALFGIQTAIKNSPGISLQPATTTSLGGIKVGSNLSITADGTLSANSGSGGSYVLPTATSSRLGGVKIGSGVNVGVDGTISVANTSYTLPTASSSRLGGIKVGANLTIASDGTLSATGGGGSSYVLPVATATTLGGVKQGANITIATDGTISTSAPDTSVFMRKDNTPDLQVSEAQTQFNDSVTFQDDINIAVSSTASVAPLVNFSKAQYVSVPSTPTSAAGTTADDNKAATKKYVDDAKSASASDATTKANAALTSANTHSDTQDVVTLQSAKDYTDTNKYTLTPATTTTLGGVKVGSGLSITSDGTLNASGGSGGGGDVTAAGNNSFTGNNTFSGVVQITGATNNFSAQSIAHFFVPAVTDASNGFSAATVNYVKSKVGTPYTLPEATSSVLGGVKIGSGINVTADGTISVSGGGGGGGLPVRFNETSLDLNTLTATSEIVISQVINLVNFPTGQDASASDLIEIQNLVATDASANKYVTQTYKNTATGQMFLRFYYGSASLWWQWSAVGGGSSSSPVIRWGDASIGSDFDNFTTGQVWYIKSQDSLAGTFNGDLPTSAPLSEFGIITTTDLDGSYKRQIIEDISPGASRYQRLFNSGQWDPWDKVY